MSLNVLVLESVGSCVDPDGIIYPINVDGTPDTNGGIDWLDTTDEWLNIYSDGIVKEEITYDESAITKIRNFF